MSPFISFSCYSTNDALIFPSHTGITKSPKVP